MRQVEENAKWTIGVRDLMATTAGFALAIPFLMIEEGTGVGVLILFATICGLINAGSNSGSFVRGFAYGFWIPIVIVLYFAILAVCVPL